MNRARTAWVGAVGLLGAVGLTGCIGDGYSYFRHTTGPSLTYFKLPTTWHTFDQAEILRAQGQQSSSFGPNSWSLAFDGTPRASVGDVFSGQASQPTGVVRVRELSAQEQDSYSPADLRSELLGTDPLASDSGTSGKGSFNVVSFDQVTEPHGYHGMHMVVDLLASGSPTFRLNQISLLDGYGRYVYVLGIGCNTACYQLHRGVIEQVVSSWAVKAQ